jgi:hypothetical protein
MNDESSGTGGNDPDTANLHSDSRDPQSNDVTRLIVEGFPPVQPHPRVWRRITNELRIGDQRTTRTLSRWRLGMAAAFVLILGVAGLLTTSLSDGWPQGSTSGVAIRELSDPNTGAVALTVRSGPDGSSIAISAETLPTLDEASTYQLWSVVGAEVVSVGVLGRSIDSAQVHLEGDPTALALTIEATGGVAVSSATPVAVWTFAG